MIEKSKLWSLLRHLKEGEQEELQRFVAAKFHNRREVMVKLLGILLELLEENGGEIDRAGLWRRLFAGKAFRDAKMRHLMSELYALAKDFLAWQALQAAPAQKQLLLGKAFLERGVPGAFEATRRQAARSRAVHAYQDEASYLLEFQWAQAAAGIAVGAGRGMQEAIVDQFAGLDAWFMLHKLREACSMLSHQKLFGEAGKATVDMTFIAPILSRLEAADLAQQPALDIYYSAYLLLTKEEMAPFSRFLERLEQHDAHISQSEKRSLYLLAINHAVKRLNDGEQQFRATLYQLYQRGLTAGWIYENGELSPWTFKNIVTTGLRQNLYAEVRAFIDAYQVRLPESHRYEYVQLASAELYFAQADYRAVLKSVRFVHLRDPITQLRLRVIRVKACFELQEWSLLDAQLDNFDNYLRRSRHSTYHQTRYRNFIHLVKRLVNMESAAAKDQAKLAAEIQTTEELIERDWLAGFAQVK